MADENKEYDGIRYRVETGSPAVFRILFAVLVIWAVGFMAYYLFSGWSSEAEFSRKKQAGQEQRAAGQGKGSAAPAAGGHKEAPKEEYIAMGKKEYGERCVSCHGPDARGGIGPDLTRKEFTFGKTEQAVTESIAGGRPGGMPSYKGELSHEKIEGLVRFILSL